MAGAAILLAGCASSPTIPDETITSPPAMAGESTELNWSDTNMARQFPASRPIRPGVPVVRPNPAPAPPVMTWTSLDRWAVDNQLNEPRLISHTPVAAFALRTASGTMVLDIGSREAAWNGVEIQLGFAPQLIDDQVFVHGLDLQKTLAPLLLGQPLEFGNRVIVIDPGHGGKEAGAKSVLNNRYEKEFTLDLGLRLAPLLATNGWQVFLTRTGDEDVALSNRVAFAEMHHADLFVSLHFNSAAPDQNAAGLETYCLTPSGMPSTLTRGFPDIWSQVFPNNAFNNQSLLFAVRLQTALVRDTGLEDRGVGRARFIGVLRGQRRAALLIEAGYLSNPHEARRIESPEFRQKLALSIAEALK